MMDYVYRSYIIMGGHLSVKIINKTYSGKKRNTSNICIFHNSISNVISSILGLLEDGAEPDIEHVFSLNVFSQLG